MRVVQSYLDHHVIDFRNGKKFLAVALLCVSDTHNTTKMAAEDSSGKGLLIKSDVIAEAFHKEVKSGLANCSSRPPKLVGILASSSSPSKSYATFTKKQCEELGVEFVLRTAGAAQSSDLGEGEGVEEAIIEANEDETVDGIMVRNSNLFRSS